MSNSTILIRKISSISLSDLRSKHDYKLQIIGDLCVETCDNKQIASLIELDDESTCSTLLEAKADILGGTQEIWTGRKIQGFTFMSDDIDFDEAVECSTANLLTHAWNLVEKEYAPLETTSDKPGYTYWVRRRDDINVTIIADNDGMPSVVEEGIL